MYRRAPGPVPQSFVRRSRSGSSSSSASPASRVPESWVFIMSCSIVLAGGKTESAILDVRRNYRESITMIMIVKLRAPLVLYAYITRVFSCASDCGVVWCAAFEFSRCYT